MRSGQLKKKKRLLEIFSASTHQGWTFPIFNRCSEHDKILIGRSLQRAMDGYEASSKITPGRSFIFLELNGWERTMSWVLKNLSI